MTKPRKERLNITISKLTQDLINELRTATDADSDSEVIRNAVRLSYAINEATKEGAKLIIEASDGTSTHVSFLGSMSKTKV